MAIVQRNLYIPGQNLTNLANNVDYNRLGLDLTDITVNFGVVPAQVTIRQGSLIECNGNLYAIEGADYTFAMANAAHNYITFTDVGAPAFSSAATVGTFDAIKQGFYQAGNQIRTLKWWIDQTAAPIGNKFWLSHEILEQYYFQHFERYTKFKAYMTLNQNINTGVAATVQYNAVSHDVAGEFNTGTYTYTAGQTMGYYLIHVRNQIDFNVNVTGIYVVIYNGAGANMAQWVRTFPAGNADRITCEMVHMAFLPVNNNPGANQVSIQAVPTGVGGTITFISGANESEFSIYRIR